MGKVSILFTGHCFGGKSLDTPIFRDISSWLSHETSSLWTHDPSNIPVNSWWFQYVSMIQSWFESETTINHHLKISLLNWDPWTHHFSGLRWAKPCLFCCKKCFVFPHPAPQHHLAVGQAARQAKKLGICLARRESCAPGPRGPGVQWVAPKHPQSWKIHVLSSENHRTHLNVQAMVDCQRVNQEGKKNNCPPNLCPIVARLEQPWCHWLEIVQKTEFVEKYITSLTKSSPVLRTSQMCLFQWGCAPNYGSVW